MAGVLVTRPASVAQPLAARLDACGYTPFVVPLLDIRPTRTPPPTLQQGDALMLTSGQALTTLAAAYPAFLAEARAYPCYCVGPRTARLAEQAGLTVPRFGTTDGAALARLILAETPRPRRILHLAGQTTASAAATLLTNAGLPYLGWVLYQATAISTLPPELITALRGDKIQAALFFSPRTARVFTSLLGHKGLISCCSTLTAIGLSEAVATALRPCPWRLIGVAARPSEDAMLETLAKLVSLAPRD